MNGTNYMYSVNASSMNMCKTNLLIISKDGLHLVEQMLDSR